MHRTLLVLAVLSPALAHAAPTATVSSTDQLVEIAWTDPGHERTRIAVPLPFEHACSKVELDQDKATIAISVCRDAGPADAAQLQLGVERSDRNAPTTFAMKLQAAVVIKRGASIAIGRFQRANQPVEIVAAIR